MAQIQDPGGQIELSSKVGSFSSEHKDPQITKSPQEAQSHEEERDLDNAGVDAATASSSAQISNPVSYSAPRPHPGKKKFIRRKSKTVIADDKSSAEISISNSKSSSNKGRGQKRRRAALEQSSLSGDWESNSSSSKSGKSNRRSKKQRVEEAFEVEPNINEEQMSEKYGHIKQKVDFAEAEKIMGASDVIFLTLRFYCSF
jgi:hypothetical protein